MRRVVRIVLMLGLLGWAIWHQGQPVQEAGRLAPVLTELATLRVAVWRDQDWCRCFAYPGGQFIQSTHETTCGLFAGKAVPFTPQATADFERVRAAVAGSRVKVLWVTATYGSNGAITEAEFALDGVSRRAYIYAPAHGALPPDQGREIWYEPIDADWYIRNEDWN